MLESLIQSHIFTIQSDTLQIGQIKGEALSDKTAYDMANFIDAL